MIFVTVGTHEQPFNRLIEEIDRLKGENLIEDEVVIQKGYSTYIPKYCKYFDILPYEDMIKYVKEASIVITHGGPASFIIPLSMGKTPIVVPRQKKFGEHVNDHQLEFSIQYAQITSSIFVVKSISTIYNLIIKYGDLIKYKYNFNFNNLKFNKKIIDEIKVCFK